MFVRQHLSHKLDLWVAGPPSSEQASREEALDDRYSRSKLAVLIRLFVLGLPVPMHSTMADEKELATEGEGLGLGLVRVLGLEMILTLCSIGLLLPTNGAGEHSNHGMSSTCIVSLLQLIPVTVLVPGMDKIASNPESASECGEHKNRRLPHDLLIVSDFAQVITGCHT